MNWVKLVAFAGSIFLASSATHAYMVTNNNPCSAQGMKYRTARSLSEYQQVPSFLSKAAGKIDTLEDQPLIFAIDIAAGTAVRARGSNSEEPNQDGSREIYKIASFAVSTPQCLGGLNQLSDGVDCIIQLPNKTITITIVSNDNMGTYVIAGVYSTGTNILGEAERLTEPLARELQQNKILEKRLSVPFAIIGFVMKGLHKIAEIIFYENNPDHSPPTNYFDFHPLTNRSYELCGL